MPALARLASPLSSAVLLAVAIATGGAATVALAHTLERGPTVVALPAAAPTPPPGTPTGFTASGTATIEAVPDVADLVATVAIEKARAPEAARLVRQQADALVAALAAAGVGGKDVSLSEVDLAPVHETVDARLGTTRLRGYRAAVTVTIATRDFGRIADLMEVAANAGAGTVATRFRVDDLPALKRKVRAMAAEAARDKARDLAAALDVELGAVRAIAEQPGDGWSWNGTYANAVVREESGALAHGTLQRITMTVDVTYALGEA